MSEPTPTTLERIENSPGGEDRSEAVAAAPSGEAIAAMCLETMDLLLAKNRAYGNSALEPVRIFSKAGPVEQIYARLDDKIARIQKGQDYPGEDTIDDILGYLILLKIAKKQHGTEGEPA